MNLPRHIIEARLSTLNALIARGGSIKEAAIILNVQTNNIRELMHRRGIALPIGWQPRPTRKTGVRLPEGSAMCPDQHADPSALTEEEREAAERFGIRFERAAWLITCEFSGNARGLAVTR